MGMLKRSGQQRLAFFKEKMEVHETVQGIEQISDADGKLVYELSRNGGLPPVRVWISESYLFTELEYYSRPASISAGDFILILNPYGSSTKAAATVAKQDSVGIGILAWLMGALWKRCPSDYVPPSMREMGDARNSYGSRN